MTNFATRLVPAPASVDWRHVALAFGMTVGICTSSVAWAQGIPSGTSGAISHANRRQAGPQEKPELPLPEAIPGAKAREPAAPATRLASDMQPTDALFDAINRGDIAGARDALNRGADLNGVNILGMTPMELSVDLGRNDISFLLLSVRGEDSGRGSRAVGRDVAATRPAAAKPSRPAKPATVAKNVAPRNIPVATKPIATPKLFANDGGAPLPSSGFLGFGPQSSTN